MAVGEPFGWVTTGPNGIFSKSREMLAFCQGEDVIPLYAHPPTAQVAERQPLTGWQPIETAPRDGTNVLLVNHKGNMATGMWMNSPFSIGWWLRGGIGPDAFFNDHFGPAAWQPLPTPPGIVSSSSSGEGSSNV